MFQNTILNFICHLMSSPTFSAPSTLYFCSIVVHWPLQFLKLSFKMWRLIFTFSSTTHRALMSLSYFDFVRVFKKLWKAGPICSRSNSPMKPLPPQNNHRPSLCSAWPNLRIYCIFLVVGWKHHWTPINQNRPQWAWIKILWCLPSHPSI